ncbi:MAG: hypothetical protein L0215_13595 [Gemmataceae bacterium]|nr:hypothetical protein [Gemmataceae bacterium]
MTNDAKLGLILGLAVVLLIGIVFVREAPAPDGTGAAPTAALPSPSASNPAASAPFQP